MNDHSLKIVKQMKIVKSSYPTNINSFTEKLSFNFSSASNNVRYKVCSETETDACLSLSLF